MALPLPRCTRSPVRTLPRRPSTPCASSHVSFALAAVAKLEQQVARRAIICLQEVSRTWGARLHVYFRERGYTLLASHYDGAFSGYMGVAIAVPLDAYEMLDADVTRISDVKKWQREPPPSAVRKFLDAVAAVPAGALDGAWEGLLRAVPRNVKSSLISAAQKFRAARRDDREIATGKPFADPWPASRRRLNTAVSARVRDREGGARLAVTTYHMPCLFLQPQVMTIHAALAAQHARAFAGDDPHVLCGDFNFKPHEGLPPIPCYRLLTTGAIDERHEGYPTPPSWEPWRPVVEPLVSAYAEAAGEEPLFTNYVTFPDGSEFCETLDYIFHSGGDMACVGVLPTPETRHDCGPLPSVDEPSDHLMIGATLRVPVPTGQK